MLPRGPRMPDKQPRGHQTSCQKEVSEPDLTSILCKGLALSLYFNIFLHIHEPDELFPRIDQKFPFRIRFLRTQVTHKESLADTNRHMSFKMLTVLDSERSLKPSPPSLIGLQMSLQATFAFFGFKSGPDHKKAENILSISFMHLLGSRKADSQTLVRLERTDFISWRRPANDKNRPVQEVMRVLIRSSKGR